MKCKKHPQDESSSAGVCASCLRQRLSALIAAQIQAAQINHLNEHEELSEASHHAHTHFPRSVSPYMSRQKLVPDRHNKDNYHSLPAHKFFCTPQIGPAGKIIVDDNNIPHKKKGIGKLWLFKNLFRSKSAITSTDLDPRVSESRETISTTIPSRSWFSSIARKQLRTCSLDESKINCQRTSNNHHNRGRGMSPAICSDEEDDDKHCHVATSAATNEELRQTPRRTPARTGGGARRRHLGRNVSDIVFCLSPLVRPSPNRIWNQKGGGVAAAEMGGSGEARVPVMDSNSVAAAFSKNRSRKLADFGRCKRTH
ncbi:hypothetical protein LIER_36109 [Lithospermum erythrorhizon]|uniref:Uncharacterized protein n=1 Tax=Lithospermum erythrorhizon TaxID=34254 RepID=A0AAV3P513_LITER